ncbi:hypothetical protein BDQ17DRAFT_1439629 [Cyathus striatus]|nr:hypothetical protein BDQ17DRAFT_1439629 [Cyathus striatus]
MSNPTKTTAKVLPSTSTSAIPGISTSLSPADTQVTLNICWTLLCDLFLLLIADSVYDARSRVLLELLTQKLGLGWLDVVKFESWVTEALETQEDVEKLEQREMIDGARKALRKRRIVMLGLVTLGGGLVIGLSAGLLAPVIGTGLAGALTTVGVTGTGAFLGGTACAAVITTGRVLTGSGIAMKGMANRTQYVRTFDILPLHNNKRVSCVLTVPGFMSGVNDDVCLPFSVLDPIIGDVFSVLWEPEMIRETGSALKILTGEIHEWDKGCVQCALGAGDDSRDGKRLKFLTGEVLSKIGLTVLQATAMTTLMSALHWPITTALDRAKSAGRVLTDVLNQRHLGVRPIILIGFSLGAHVIFYALGWFSRRKSNPPKSTYVLRPPSTATYPCTTTPRTSIRGEDELSLHMGPTSVPTSPTKTSSVTVKPNDPVSNLPAYAGFDMAKIKEVLGDADAKETGACVYEGTESACSFCCISADAGAEYSSWWDC